MPFFYTAQAQTTADEVVLQSALKTAEQNLRKKLPVRQDEITIFENATHQQKTFILDYKIEQVYSQAQEINFTTSAKKLNVNFICGSPMRQMLDLGGVIKINYKNLNNKLFTTIDITKSSCNVQ